MRYLFSTLLGTAVLAAALPCLSEESASAASGSNATVDSVRDCMKANLPERSIEQDIKLASVDRGGSERRLDARLYWQRDEESRVQANIRVSAPPDLAGSSYLLLEKESRDDLYMYLPATQRSRRIVGSMMAQPVWGTDLSYEDVKRLQGIVDDGQVSRLPDAEVQGRAVFQLKLVPAVEEESPYREMILSVDQETCVVIHGEFFEAGPDPVKRLTADPTKLTREQDRWYPQMIRMVDLRDDSHTTLEVIKVTFDPDLPSRLFSSQSFYRGN